MRFIRPIPSLPHRSVNHIDYNGYGGYHYLDMSYQGSSIIVRIIVFITMISFVIFLFSFFANAILGVESIGNSNLDKFYYFTAKIMKLSLLVFGVFFFILICYIMFNICF